MNYIEKYEKYQKYFKDGRPVEPPEYRRGKLIEAFWGDAYDLEECEYKIKDNEEWVEDGIICEESFADLPIQPEDSEYFGFGYIPDKNRIGYSAALYPNWNPDRPYWADRPQAYLFKVEDTVDDNTPNIIKWSDLKNTDITSLYQLTNYTSALGYLDKVYFFDDYPNCTDATVAFEGESSYSYTAPVVRELYAYNLKGDKIKRATGMFRLNSLRKLIIPSFTGKSLEVCSQFFGGRLLNYLDISSFVPPAEDAHVNNLFYNTDNIIYIKCRRDFYEWCMEHKDTITLPSSMLPTGRGKWDIIN